MVSTRVRKTTLKEFVNSKEVQNQQISSKEMELIFESLGLENYKEYQKKIMPLLKAYKTELFKMALYEVKFSLCVPNYSIGPRTIPLSNIFISGIVDGIFHKIKSVLPKNMKNPEIEIKVMNSEIKQLIHRNSKMLKNREKENLIKISMMAVIFFNIQHNILMVNLF